MTLRIQKVSRPTSAILGGTAGRSSYFHMSKTGITNLFTSRRGHKRVSMTAITCSQYVCHTLLAFFMTRCSLLLLRCSVCNQESTMITS